MGVVKFEGSDGERQISSFLDYDNELAAWIVDVSNGGVEDIGMNVDRLVIPEHRVYEVQLTPNELDDSSGTGTF